MHVIARSKNNLKFFILDRGPFILDSKLVKVDAERLVDTIFCALVNRMIPLGIRWVKLFHIVFCTFVDVKHILEEGSILPPVVPHTPPHVGRIVHDLLSIALFEGKRESEVRLAYIDDLRLVDGICLGDFIDNWVGALQDLQRFVVAEDDDNREQDQGHEATS